MKTKNQYNRLLFIFIPTVMIFLTVFVWGLGLFTDIEEEPYVSGETDRIVVGVSQLGSESGWRTANTESVQSVFTNENGYFLLFSNARQKQENQIKAIRSFISQRVDYIVFAPVVENGWRTVLQEAKEAGIPVIMMDRKVEAADQELCVSWVGTDSRQEGVKAGRWLEGHLRDKGVTGEETVNIVVLTGTEGASSAIGRSEGFREVARDHANWKILEEKLEPYWTQLRTRERLHYQNIMDEIFELFDMKDFQNDNALSGVYLIGFHNQSYALRKRAKDEETVE